MCTAPDDEVAASDSRRTQIASMKEEVVEQLGRGRLYQAIKLSKEILTLLEEEDLVPLFSEQYDAIARIYWALKDRRNAERYGRKALEVLGNFGYVDPENEQDDLNMLLANFDD
jgi:ABC-type branched-subunit amino acid transport system ATPase component